jgi:hypothetical protein
VNPVPPVPNHRPGDRATRLVGRVPPRAHRPDADPGTAHHGIPAGRPGLDRSDMASSRDDLEDRGCVTVRPDPADDVRGRVSG